MKRRVFLVLCVAAAVLVAGPPAVRANTVEEGAAHFITSLADKAIEALTDPSVPKEKREGDFRRLFNEHFAVRTIARWVLGRHWRKATEAELNEYLRLFEDMIVATYLDRFAEYAGETLIINKTLLAGERDAVVYSVINRPRSGDPIRQGRGPIDRDAQAPGEGRVSRAFAPPP
jgi:phospholipid transport system substrate-binding protein